MRVRSRESLKDPFQRQFVLNSRLLKGSGFYRRWYSLVVFLLATLHSEAPGQQTLAREYQIKAVFLFNFTQFIEWPEAAFKGPDSPLVIGILGQDPFGDYIDQTIRGEVVGNRPLVIKRFAHIGELEDCHILFFGLDTRQKTRDALGVVRSKPILTVSDTDGFARMGGTVRFYDDAGRIKIRINMKSAAEADLVVSSKLLRLADVIGENDN
jgi:hypothetical protein